MATFLQRIAGAVGIGEDEPGPTTDLTEWLDATLKDELKISKIQRDEDGDIPIAVGSSLLFIRQGDDESPFVTVFAPLLSDFRMSPEVFDAVNAINRKIPMAKVIIDEDDTQIVMSIELPVINSLSPEDLMLAIEIVSTEADHYDTLLQKRFGGTTALDDDHDEIDV